MHLQSGVHHSICDEGTQECVQTHVLDPLPVEAHTTLGMSNIFLYIAVYIMYFLAMALHCQHNKHIILSGVDNCTTIQFAFLTVAAAAGFDLRMEVSYM